MSFLSITAADTPEAAGAIDAKWRRRTRLFQQVIVTLFALLDRWRKEASTCEKSLDLADHQIRQTMEESEAAVLSIARGFGDIVSKTQKQTAIAKRLLTLDEHILDKKQTTQAGSYDSLLLRFSENMAEFSTDIQKIVENQKTIADHTNKLNDVVDELSDLATKVSRIALDGSIAMTSQVQSAQAFIEMTDRIRGISERANELTRRTRLGLDGIRDEIRTSRKQTVVAAEKVASAIQLVSGEIKTLNAKSATRIAEVDAAITQINEIGDHVAKDIGNIVIAIQFQDINNQRLANLRQSTLGGVRESLNRLEAESQKLARRDTVQAVRSYSESGVLSAAR